jgi:hypothetical protein
MADKSTGLKPPALEFKCNRLLTKFVISPDEDHTFAQRGAARELVAQVSNLPEAKQTRARNQTLRHCLIV